MVLRVVAAGEHDEPAAPDAPLSGLRKRGHAVHARPSITSSSTTSGNSPRACGGQKILAVSVHGAPDSPGASKKCLQIIRER